MLEYIRSHAKGWLAWVIVGIITVPFALWGIHNYVGGGGPGFVAKVGDSEISAAHFENVYQQQRMQLEQMFGGQLPEIFSEQMLRSQTLQQMIEQEVILHHAAAQQMRISDQQLVKLIRSVEAFYQDGHFSQELYVDLLRRQGMTPAMFEQRLYRDLVAEQLESAFTASTFVTEHELNRVVQLESQQRVARLLHIPAETFRSQLQLSDEQLATWYAEHAARFAEPEQVKVDYLEIKLADLANSITVSDDEVRQRYESQLENYRSPEERRASHILVQIPSDADDAQIRQAREKAEGLLQRLREGADFTTLASEYSDDPGSARQGGDLGFFGRGVMVASFEDVTFALEKGQISELVRSPFGFHIIRLDDVRGGELKSLGELSAMIAEEIRQEQALQRFYELGEKLATYTYEQADTLAFAASELGLSIKTSPFFTRRGGEGIAAHNKVVEAAFSDDVLLREVNSEPLSITREHTVVLRLNTHHPATTPELAEVQDRVRSALEQEQVAQMAQQQANDLLEQLNSGAEIEVAPYQWQAPVKVSRDSQSLDPRLQQALFTMPRPQPDQAGYSVVGMANGDHYLIKLEAITTAGDDGITAEHRDSVRMQLIGTEAQQIMDAVAQSFRDRVDVVIRQ